jgi:xanthine dehydrogenase YagS FAD-binding subunit
MLPSFAYVRPTSLGDTLRRLAEPGARAHAGGTDLLGCLRDGVLEARTIVSLTALRELEGIGERADGSLRIGARATLAEIASHPMIRRRWTALAEAAASAASPQLRAQGTLGGNLCQRPRCWYFRGDFQCVRKGGDVCYAMSGENELHAIFGGSSCYVVHPSDAAAPLVAFDARVRIAAATGERLVPLAEFFVSPEQDPTRENVLRPGELAMEVIVPAAMPELTSAYRKARVRRVWDFALAGVAVVLETSRGAVSHARVVLSGVAPIPWRAAGAEAALAGRRLDATVAATAAAAAVTGAEPLDQNGYKVDLVRGLVQDALLALGRRSATGAG